MRAPPKRIGIAWRGAAIADWPRSRRTKSTIAGIAERPVPLSSSLTLLTNRRARNVAELLGHVREVPGSSIYFHTHHFLIQHHYLSPEPPNDFAYWVSNVLGEDRLGEQLAAIDIIQFRKLAVLRERIIAVMEVFL
jgi:hypothetical protein